MRSTGQRIARLSVALVALGQAAALTVAAWFTLLGGRTAILRSYNSTADLAAWSAPFPGPGGAAIVGAQVAIILICLMLALRARGAWQHMAHAILLGWILFWFYRIGHMAIVFNGWLHWALMAGCLLAAFAQITLWRAAPDPPTRGSRFPALTKPSERSSPAVAGA